MQPCRETASRTAPFVQSLRQSQPSKKQTAHRQQLPVQAAACTAAPHKRRMRPYYVPIKPRDMIRRQRNQAYASDQSRSAETLKTARSFPDSRYIRKQIPDTPARKSDGFPANNKATSVPMPCASTTSPCVPVSFQKYPARRFLSLGKTTLRPSTSASGLFSGRNKAAFTQKAARNTAAGKRSKNTIARPSYYFSLVMLQFSSAFLLLFPVLEASASGSGCKQL